ncbi:MAG: hypothetical protein NTV33_07920 [Coprothermobacterota bacterium]|nr:hypothetical protein [Coprothermobacterota bacterium]
MLLEAISKVLPIVLLFLLGILLRRRKAIQPGTVADLKMIVVNFALPSLLFLTFARVTLEGRFFILTLTIAALGILVLWLSGMLRRLLRIRSPYFQALLPGFEGGMIGYGIYSSAYGSSNLYKLGVMDLGQAIFFFGFMLAFLERLRNRSRSLAESVRASISSPPLLAILFGIAINLSGVMPALDSRPLSVGVLKTLEIVGSLTLPLIGIVIGYEIQLSWKQLPLPALTSLLRVFLWVGVALLLNTFLLDGLLHLDRGFQAALMTLLILPPSFITLLYLPKGDDETQAYVVNTLSLSTLLTLALFPLVILLYPP